MERNEFTKRIDELKKNGTGQTPNRQKEPAGRIDYETKKLQADAQRAREICFMHAKATRETEMLREELIKGTAAGEESPDQTGATVLQQHQNLRFRQLLSGDLAVNDKAASVSIFRISGTAVSDLVFPHRLSYQPSD